MSVVLFSVVYCIGLIFLIVRLFLPLREYHFEGDVYFENTSIENAVIFDKIALPPGVYLINLDYQAAQDLSTFCNVKDDTVFFGGLLTDGEALYSARKQTGFHVWLYESTENLRVEISFDGNGTLEIGNLTIKETRGLWLMLFTVLLFGGAMVYAVLGFFCYDRTYGIEQGKKQVIFWLAGISFAVSIPYLCGYNIAGVDLPYHLYRIEGVKDGLLGGQFPVRLEPQWLFDHGYACGIFCCNIFLYFPALLRILGFPVVTCYNMYCIALNMVTVWIAYYCFQKIFGKRSIGVVCSALYTLSIYRIYKLLIIGAVDEGSALTFLPLVLYGLYRIFMEEPRKKQCRTAWIPLMIGYAGLIQTHILTFEITIFVTVILCLLYVKKLFQWRILAEIFKGALGATLVSLWFLVPFLDYCFTQDIQAKHCAVRTVQSKGGYLAHQLLHFWTGGEATSLKDTGMWHSYPEGVGLVLVLGVVLFLILWFLGAFRNAGEKTIFTKKVALIGVLLLFMSLNIFPWDRIQMLHPFLTVLISNLQFPNRFLGWGTLCLVLVFGYCMEYLSRKERRGYWGMTALALIGIITSSLYLIDDVNHHQNCDEIYTQEGIGVNYLSNGEYLIQGTDVRQLTFSDIKADGKLQVSSWIQGPLKAVVNCENFGSEMGFIDIPLLLYKGYCAFDIETGQKFQVTASDNYGVRVMLPAHYKGRVMVEFVSPLYWRISEIASCVFIAAMIAYWGCGGKRGVRQD